MCVDSWHPLQIKVADNTRQLLLVYAVDNRSANMTAVRRDYAQRNYTSPPSKKRPTGASEARTCWREAAN